MSKFMFSFGSKHLQDFNVDPAYIFVTVEAEDENAARDIIFNTEGIGRYFCMSYPYTEERIKKFTNEYYMTEMTLQELLLKHK